MQPSDEFLNDPYNLACFDCHIPRPTVANLKLGVLICVKCARQQSAHFALKLVGDKDWSG
jgi:hypothetical protein